MTARESLTKNQACVLEKLEAASGPLSAYTLLDQLRERGFRAPLQVYRALDALVKEGLVHRLESLNAFVACAEPHDHAHSHSHSMTAFAICDKCGQVTEYCDPAISHQLDEWMHSTGFAANRAVIEFRGTCAKCLAQAA
jgi:Fur family zinc uptake transcriptional regulator